MPSPDTLPLKPRNPDFRAGVERIFRAAPFVADLGLRLVNVSAGQCETDLAVQPKHFQQDGYLHAGVLATMADHTAGSAGTSLVAAGEYVLTVEFKINFLRAAQGARLCCKAVVLKPGRRIIVVESEVYAVGSGAIMLVAKALVTLAVLQQSHPKTELA